MENTAPDFWQMVWEQEVRIIVMATEIQVWFRIYLFLINFTQIFIQEVQLAKLMQIESCIEGNKLHKLILG